MNLRNILKSIFYFSLLCIAILTVFVSLFHDSLLIFDPTSFITGLGVLFAIVFALFKRIFIKNPDKTFFEEYSKNQIVIILKSEFEHIIYKAFVKSGNLFLAFCLVNLLLAIYCFLFQDFISIGNIIMSSGLIWFTYGKFQIRNEIQKSIYYESIIKQEIKEDSIEIHSDKLHHDINFHNLKYLAKTDKWTILRRIKFDDYILIRN